MRTGTPEEPELYVSAWRDLSPAGTDRSLSDVYGQTAVDTLESGIMPSERWGAGSRQGALVSAVYQELVISPLLQEMLSGYFTSSQTIVEMYRTVVGLIPDYPFPLEVQPPTEP